jgi:opine dehydrogenase
VQVCVRVSAGSAGVMGLWLGVFSAGFSWARPSSAPREHHPSIPSQMSLNVVIVGGGNSSHVLAGLATNAGHAVTLLTRQPDRWSKTVTCQNQDPGWISEAGPSISGELTAITSDAAACIPAADVVILGGIPVHHYRSVLQQVCPHISKPGVLLGSLCAYGGFSWLCQEALGNAASTTVVFGTQSIPWTCGTLTYGSEGVVFGAKRHLHIAFDNEAAFAGTTNEALKGKDALLVVQQLLRNAIVERTDFLTCTLWPNNPLFHPTVLYGLFADWDMETPYKVEDVPARIYADVTQKR